MAENELKLACFKLIHDLIKRQYNVIGEHELFPAMLYSYDTYIVFPNNFVSWWV